MTLRPSPARWFELLCARDDLTLAVEALARTGAVEVEADPAADRSLALPDLRERLARYRRLAQRYHHYWPAPEQLHPSAVPEQPIQAFDHALERLHAWREQARPLVRRLEQLRAERTELGLLDDLLTHGDDDLPEPALLAGAGPVLAVRLFVLAPGAPRVPVPDGVIDRLAATPNNTFLVLLGPPQAFETLEQDLVSLKARQLHLPQWLHGDRAQNHRQLAERLARIEQEASGLQRDIAALTAQHHVDQALGDIARLEWFVGHMSDLPATESFAWVSGWTSDLDSSALEDALRESPARALIRFPPPPQGVRPPLVMRNPWWVRPFELFAGLLGTPGRDEADPSRLLAVIAPLLFGYMFADLGQGLVLFLAGLALRRRLPLLRLLVAGGLSSMVFGVVFGSFFSREDVFAPLWTHPIEQPLPVLMVPLLCGVVILLLGLLLNALSAHWRGELRAWVRVEAALPVLYLGLVGALLHPQAGLSLALAGLLWYFGGTLLASGGSVAALLLALAHLVGRGMQLLVNTLSFVRVGAFALAHAGLSLAVVVLADATGNAAVGALVMVLGNLLVIVLEGLVVSIQTTRLILFEFFIRFLQAQGRGFRPLDLPPSARRRQVPL